MKKNLIIFLSAALLWGYQPQLVNAADEVTVVLDGKTIDFDVPAQIIDERTMVPVRKIFEKLGMSVDWDEQEQAVLAYKHGISVKLPIDSYVAYRNTVEQSIDVPAQIIDGRTLVPVRIVSEYAGTDVGWDDDTNTVYINSKDNIQYINWNDNYYYYGETENNKAVGYGILYSKKDDSIAQLGKYINSQIVVGTDYFENGDSFVGNYTDGKRTYGIYCYSTGASYEGEFQDGYKHGEGTYYFANGSFHRGKWENDLPNGYGTFYDSVEDYQAQGVFTEGLRDGYFVIDDFYMNTTYYTTYKNGELLYSSESPYDHMIILEKENAKSQAEKEKSREIQEYYDQLEELTQLYDELNEWHIKELQKLSELIESDPFSTDWAKSIYESYGVSTGNSPADDNLDNFALANQQRQQAALKAKADAVILEQKESLIKNQKQLIEDAYQQQKQSLDTMKQTLEQKRKLLGL